MFAALLSWKAPSLRQDLRVFEVRLDLPEGVDRAVSGELLSPEVVADAHEALTVPTAAVVLRNGRPAVVVVREVRARKVVLRTGMVDRRRTEVLTGALRAGDAVVVRGQVFLEDGQRVRVQPGGKP